MLKDGRDLEKRREEGVREKEEGREGNRMDGKVCIGKTGILSIKSSCCFY